MALEGLMNGPLKFPAPHTPTAPSTSLRKNSSQFPQVTVLHPGLQGSFCTLQPWLCPLIWPSQWGALKVSMNHLMSVSEPHTNLSRCRFCTFSAVRSSQHFDIIFPKERWTFSQIDCHLAETARECERFLNNCLVDWSRMLLMSRIAWTLMLMEIVKTSQLDFVRTHWTTESLTPSPRHYQQGYLKYL